MRAAVESTGLDVFYGLAFDPAPSLAAVSSRYPALSEEQRLAIFARELAVQGEPSWPSGVITVPAVDSLGAPLFAPAPATNRIRYSCGATLVSPSYAVTAGHCVLDDSDLSELRLRLYRPTTKLAETYTTAELLGAFPTYSQPKLSASDGYLFDEYTCSVENRCYQGANVDCPPSALGADSALLRCEGRPGDKYGFLNVNESGAPTGKEALMHWKHEVLDLGAQEGLLPRDRLDHYVMRTSDPAQNYHYFDGAADLLPLRSIGWQNGAPTTWVTSIAADTHGCHGSSGSGLLVRVGQTSLYELVGPVIHGESSLAQRLCSRVPNPGGSPSGQGTAALSVDGANPNTLLAVHQNELAADCVARAPVARDLDDLPFSPGTHAVSTLFSHLRCQVDAFGADGGVTAAPSFGPYPEKFVDTPVGVTHGLGAFTLEDGADYRLGVQVMPSEPCAGPCEGLRFTASTLTLSAAPHASEPSLVAVAFAAPASVPAALTITNEGPRRALGGVVLIREGQVNSFDTPEDRLEAALYALDEQGGLRAGPLPMRFTGDGGAGFQALLRPGERLALLRQALVQGRRWTVRLGTPSYQDLTCGLLDRAGVPRVTAPCAEILQLDDRDGTEARLGFFVELASTSSLPSAEVRYVALASDAARDGDDDSVPEVLDNCPNDWNAAQGACSEEPIPAEGGSGGEGGDGGAGGDTGGASEGGSGGESEAEAGEAGAVTSPTAGNGN
ncbi:MAG TPA: hypothetical protein VGK73_19795, partial [Polyangiaceae bacterium]